VKRTVRRRHVWGPMSAGPGGPLLICGRCMLRVLWVPGTRARAVRMAAPANQQGYTIAPRLNGCPGAVPR
jgi:hypothetical protein